MSDADWPAVAFGMLAAWGFLGAITGIQWMWRLGVMGMLVMIALAAQGLFPPTPYGL